MENKYAIFQMCEIDILLFYKNINILVANLNGRDYLGEEGVNGRIKLDHENWIQLAQDRIQWHALFNMDMKLGSSIKPKFLSN
jgi:hypothetical protein